MAITQAPTSTISYIDPDGYTWLLSDLLLAKGYIATALDGVTGLPISLTSVPMLTGQALPQMYIPQPVSITLGIYAECQNVNQMDKFRALLDSIVYAFFNVRNGQPAPGYLIMAHPDGTQRQIAVYTTGGLESAEYGPLFASWVLTLQALDPFWSDLIPQSISYGLPGVSPGMLPILPINLGSSNIIGSSTLLNDGGADSYPIWDIYGPGTPTIANATTGRSFTLSNPISAGDSVHVVTQPSQQQVYKTSTSTSIWNQLVINSPRDLWPIVRGSNNISLSMSGSGPGSKIVLTWTRRWLRG
jgi:hypothetical protein